MKIFKNFDTLFSIIKFIATYIWPVIAIWVSIFIIKAEDFLKNHMTFTLISLISFIIFTSLLLVLLCYIGFHSLKKLIGNICWLKGNPYCRECYKPLRIVPDPRSSQLWPVFYCKHCDYYPMPINSRGKRIHALEACRIMGQARIPCLPEK